MGVLPHKRESAAPSGGTPVTLPLLNIATHISVCTFNLEAVYTFVH
jgi:hypothetical protein